MHRKLIIVAMIATTLSTFAAFAPVHAQGAAPASDPSTSPSSATTTTAAAPADADAPLPDAAEAPLTAEELDRRLRLLERKEELAAEAAAEKAKTAVTSSASAKDGFSFKSADSAFLLKLRGYVQFDGRFFQDDDLERAIDTFTLRRVRPIIEGTLWSRFDFRIMPDFGGGQTVLFDAYLDGRFSPSFRVRAGKFKPPVGLERLASGTDLWFVERGLPTNLVPNRDLGVQLWGEPARGRVSYAVGLFNGVVDGGNGDNDVNDRKELAGRLFFQPFKENPGVLQGLGFGVGASSGESKGTLAAPGLAAYRTPGQLTFFSYRSDATAAGTVVATGDRVRLAPQLTYTWGPFELFGEWTTSSQELARGPVATELEHEAWQVAAGWIVTGENATLRTPNPANPFDPAKDGWGGLEIVARAHGMEVDPDSFPVFANPATSASKIDAVGVGVNWILNRNLKLQLDYEVSSFEGGAAGGADRADEKILFSRFQIAF